MEGRRDEPKTRTISCPMILRAQHVPSWKDDGVQRNVVTSLTGASLCGLVAIALPASATEKSNPAWRLVYDSSVAECPTYRRVREQIVAHLGFDPFRADEADASELWITIRSEGDGLVATVARRDGGQTVGERELRAGGDCSELATSAALAGSILVDPDGSVAERHAQARPTEQSATSAPSRAEDPWADVDPPPAPPSPPPTPNLESALALRSIASVGLAAGPSMGLSLDASLRRAPWEVRLEARGDLPVAADQLPDGAGVKTRLLVGSLVPCWARSWARLCGVASAGAMLARSQSLTPAEDDETLFGAVGIRPMASVQLVGPLDFVASVEGLIPLRRLDVTVRDQRVWSTPAVAGALGLGLEVRFF